MSSPKRDPPLSPAVSFIIPELPLTPASLLSNASSSHGHTARSTLVNPYRLRRLAENNNITNQDNNNNNNISMDRSSSVNYANTPCDNSQFLLNPSQTINVSLTALATSTTNELGRVWDELGLSPEDRADQLTDLVSSFEQLCTGKIESEKMVASNYRQTIAEYKEEIRSTTSALKMDLDESLLRDESELTLQDEIMTLEMKLEDLRSVADVSRNELIRYKNDLMDCHKALGLTIEDKWLDITSDITRDRILEFRDKVDEVDASVQYRTSAIVQFLQGCQELIVILKCDMEENPLDNKIMNSLVKGENDIFTITSIFESDTCTGISDTALDNLKQRLSDLHSTKKDRKRELNRMGDEIGQLWEKLHIPKEDQKRFAESINGLGMDTMRKGENELARLRQLKSDMMGKLVYEARERIQSLWDDTFTPQSQRDKFESMNVQNEDDFNEDLLTQHEEYIAALEKKQERVQQLVELIGKRESILAERVQLEAFQKDPNRLQQRGSSLTQQLNREEQMTKRIKKGLPVYTNRLQKRLEEWANQNNEDFAYNGEVYFDVMKRQDEEWTKYKDDQMKMKLEKKQKLRGGGPLSDTTNRTRTESRAKSRARAVSRNQNSREEPVKMNLKVRHESRTKGRNISRTRANISRGRANTQSKLRNRFGGP
jgi:protein regulator of cytokinesis 1